VVAPVAGQEGDPPPGDHADGDGRGRWPVRRVDRDLLDVVEEGIEAGAPVDADVGGDAGRAGRGLIPSGVAHADFASDDEVDVDDDEPESDDDEDDEPLPEDSDVELDELDEPALDPVDEVEDDDFERASLR
jgi:hypothetical protein